MFCSPFYQKNSVLFTFHSEWLCVNSSMRKGDITTTSKSCIFLLQNWGYKVRSCVNKMTRYHYRKCILRRNGKFTSLWVSKDFYSHGRLVVKFYNSGSRDAASEQGLKRMSVTRKRLKLFLQIYLGEEILLWGPWSGSKFVRQHCSKVHTCMHLIGIWAKGWGIQITSSLPNI